MYAECTAVSRAGCEPTLNEYQSLKFATLTTCLISNSRHLSNNVCIHFTSVYAASIYTLHLLLYFYFILIISYPVV